MVSLISIFSTFLKIGATSFGGGYAMISHINSEIVEKKKWLSSEEFTDIVTISESTPGPIAINMATYVGYKTLGLKGAIAATLGVSLPSTIIIMIITVFMSFFMNNQIIINVFWGLQCCVLSMIINACITLNKQSKNTILKFIIVLFAFICSYFLGISSILILIVCAITGLTNTLFLTRRKEKH